ncbi:DNA polymerase III subunit psi [Colwellia sp. 20A7]|uniref:DNA polymerase III subunit psi n=1 Tax=Colwellia sp. 20A7 TaxID=2689569 RepID=UPI00135C964F|nr:DNA polymerase III subunit psi [Colwellia sp. 20A7]
MAVNQRQFDQLTEMGISLWQHKVVAGKHNPSNIENDKPVINYVTQTEKTLSDLLTKQIFIDILQSVDISIGEVNHKENHLDLGLFNWYFNSTGNDNPAIYCNNNNLFSPSIAVISQSPALKKQLWQTIIKKLL